MSKENTNQSNGQPKDWIVDIYGKDERLTSSVRLPENQDFDSYMSFEAKGTGIILLQQSQWVIFRHGSPTPLIISNISDPRMNFFSERIESQIAVVGDDTNVNFRMLGENTNPSSPAANRLALLPYRGFTRADQGKELGELTGCSTMYSQVSENARGAGGSYNVEIGAITFTIEAYAENDDLGDHEGTEDTANQRNARKHEKQMQAAIKTIHEKLRLSGIANEDVETFLYCLGKKLKSPRDRVTVRVSWSNGMRCSQNATKTGWNFLMATSADLIHCDANEAFSATDLHSKESQVPNEDRCMWFADPGTALMPDYRCTRIFSENSIIGNKTEMNLTLQAEHVSTSSDVHLESMSLFTPQFIKGMLAHNDLVAIPDVLCPTGQIAKPWHAAMIKHCNDLRKSGDCRQLETILKKYFKKYKHVPDIQLSFGLSKAFALISKDKAKTVKYLESLSSIAANAENSSLLFGRIYLYKGYIALLEEDCERSLDELTKATYYLQNFKAGETIAWLCYLKAVNYKILAGECETPDVFLEQQSLHFFDLYLQHIKIEEKEGFFAHRGVKSVILKMASLHLRHYGTLGEKNFPVSAKALQAAKECLTFIKNSIVKADGQKDGELENLKLEILRKENCMESGRDVLNESISYYKTNPNAIAIGEGKLMQKAYVLEK